MRYLNAAFFFVVIVAVFGAGYTAGTDDGTKFVINAPLPPEWANRGVQVETCRPRERWDSAFQDECELIILQHERVGEHVSKTWLNWMEDQHVKAPR